MGLDIYAGTLTRYYSRSWKTTEEEYVSGKEDLYSHLRDYADEDDEPQLTPEQAEELISTWQESLVNVLNENGIDIKKWNEDAESPYYTDSPDWEAFGALLLISAGKIYDVPVELQVEKYWQFGEHTLIKHALNDENLNGTLFSGTIMWLPDERPMMFQGPLPSGEATLYGTSGGLKTELERLNEILWEADEETIISWSTTEGHPAETELKIGELIFEAGFGENTKYSTESLAKLAFSILWQAAAYSLENGVPVVMDF